MTQFCEECRIGRLHPVTTAYMDLIGRHIMVIPNVPAYHCDVCAQLLYDEGFLSYLHHILDRLSERPSVAEPRRRFKMQDDFISSHFPHRSN